MAIVFCLAILPPLISGASAGGFPLLGGSSSELVLQEGNDRAMLNGKEVSLGENAAVYRSEPAMRWSRFADCRMPWGWKWNGITQHRRLR